MNTGVYDFYLKSQLIASWIIWLFADLKRELTIYICDHNLVDFD